MPRDTEITRRIVVSAILALPLFLAACDDGGNGTYSTPADQERDIDDEQHDEYCRKHPRDC